MLTIQSRKVLFILKSVAENTDRQLCYDRFNDSFFLFGDPRSVKICSQYSGELDSILALLRSNGLITPEGDDFSFFRLTQYAIHYCQYRLSEFRRYLANKWIDFFALAVAFIALFVSASK